MICLDTNLIIYASKGLFDTKQLGTLDAAYSSITKVEALGYADLAVSELAWFNQLFGEWEDLSVSSEVIAQAISLKQQRKMSLGDAIIAATALVHGLELWTNNAKDFQGIDGLKVHIPKLIV